MTAIWFFLTSVLAAPLGVASDEAALDEHHVKIAFIYNFAKFVEWPEFSLPPGEKTLTICVIGDDEAEDFTKMLQGKHIGNRAVVVKMLQGMQEIHRCQVVFLSNAAAYDIDRLITSAKGLGILLVTENHGAAERGSMINFYLEQNRVRFEINLEAVRREGLTMSSQLLKLGRIVSTGTEKGMRR